MARRPLLRPGGDARRDLTPPAVGRSLYVSALNRDGTEHETLRAVGGATLQELA